MTATRTHLTRHNGQLALCLLDLPMTDAPERRRLYALVPPDNVDGQVVYVHDWHVTDGVAHVRYAFANTDYAPIHDGAFPCVEVMDPITPPRGKYIWDRSRGCWHNPRTGRDIYPAE